MNAPFAGAWHRFADWNEAQRAGAMARGNMCIDGVMSKPESALELLSRSRDSGYNITGVAATVPLEVSVERVQERGATTGRYMPRPKVELALTDIGEDAPVRRIKQ